LEPSLSEDDNDQMENEKSKSNKAEAEYLTTSESSHETIVWVNAAVEGSSCVGVNSNSHTNVTGKD